MGVFMRLRSVIGKGGTAESVSLAYYRFRGAWHGNTSVCRVAWLIVRRRTSYGDVLNVEGELERSGPVMVEAVCF